VDVRLQWAGCALAGILLLALPAAGQMEIGDNLSMNLNGTLGFGYSAEYANAFGSSHGFSGSGTGTLSGSYYDPNFLSFSVSPYYGQSRANSNYQSVFDSSGVSASASIFSGSHFPGSVSYAKSYNSEGSFGVPGISNYTTHGNSDTFGINWSENLPDEPSLSVGFQRGSSQYSIFGTDQQGNSTFDSVTLHSGYLYHGFGLGAFYDRGGSHSQVPQLLGTEEQPETLNSSNSGYGFNASHALPMRGGFSAGFTHSAFDTDVAGTSIKGSVDLVTANAGIQPTSKLHFGVGANYSDSLSGQLFEQIVAAGGIVPAQNINESSHGMDVTGTVSYAIAKGLQSQAEVERRQQTFLGTSFGSNSYSGGLIYTTGLLGGNFNAAGTVIDNTLDGSSQNTLGFSTTANYTRRINNWVMNGSFSYAQNVQTFLITYMSSFYNYSGNIRHRWGQFVWTAGASAGRTGLTEQTGMRNSNQSYTTGIGYSRHLTLTGTYSRGSGIGIETANGIAPSPVLVPVVTPSSAILFGGDSYSVGLASNPVRKLTLAASFAKTNSNTSLSGLAQNGSTSQYNAIFQYQLRKIYVNGGYSRLQQGFSTSTTGPAVVSSFYFGISRWFNFF
jgi:hypothetical protein